MKNIILDVTHNFDVKYHTSTSYHRIPFLSSSVPGLLTFTHALSEGKNALGSRILFCGCLSFLIVRL